MKPKLPNNTFNKELKGILEQAILNLPENYSEVYIMRELEQMNVEETSKCLGISKINVKVRLNRAKTILKELLVRHTAVPKFFISSYSLQPYCTGGMKGLNKCL